jgi:hypothetical protein
MTLQDIERDICRRLDKNATTLDPETKTRLDTFINDRYRELMRLDGINLRDEIATVTPIMTVAGQTRYVLPATHRQIIGITDKTTGHRLEQRSLSWMRHADPQAKSFGSPQYWCVLNEAAVERALSAPGAALQLVASQPVTANIVLEVQDQHSGAFQMLDLTMSNVATLAVPGYVNQVFRMALASTAPPPVPIRLQEVISTVIIAQVPVTGIGAVAESGTPHAWVVILWPIPSAICTLVVDFMRPRMMLSRPTDEPAIPEEFHTLLVWGGCSEECLKMDDDRHGEYERKYQEDVKRLRAFLHHARGERWIPGRPSRGRSDLGGHYPADSW